MTALGEEVSISVGPRAGVTDTAGRVGTMLARVVRFIVRVTCVHEWHTVRDGCWIYERCHCGARRPGWQLDSKGK